MKSQLYKEPTRTSKTIARCRLPKYRVLPSSVVRWAPFSCTYDKSSISKMLRVIESYIFKIKVFTNEKSKTIRKKIKFLQTIKQRNPFSLDRSILLISDSTHVRKKGGSCNNTARQYSVPLDSRHEIILQVSVGFLYV